MKLCFVRHGQTKFNKLGEIMGQLDEPLDLEGIEQSKALAHKLSASKVNYERIFSSTLQRAKKTAEIINEELHLPLELRDELRERNFGSLAGETFTQMDERTHQELKTKDDNQTYDYHPWGGESVEDVKNRLLKFLEYVKATYPHAGQMLVVTHTGIIRLMYLMQDKQYPEINNDSVHAFDLN